MMKEISIMHSESLEGKRRDESRLREICTTTLKALLFKNLLDLAKAWAYLLKEIPGGCSSCYGSVSGLRRHDHDLEPLTIDDSFLSCSLQRSSRYQ